MKTTLSKTDKGRLTSLTINDLRRSILDGSILEAGFIPAIRKISRTHGVSCKTVHKEIGRAHV